MLTRLATGFVLGPLLLWLLLEGPMWAVALLFFVCGGICVNELVAMVMPGRKLERAVAVLMGVTVQVLLFALSEDGHVPFGGALVAFAITLFGSALLVLARPSPMERALLRVATLWAVLVYIVVPFTLGLTLAWQPLYIVLSLTTVFAGDTGAYFVGKAFGTHKLYPAVSPKKTIEGAIGGLAASVLVAVIVKLVGIPTMSILTAAMLGLGGGFVAQVGDLTESLIKRSAGVKDSGTILPGHGGILDRVDGVIFAWVLFAAVLL